MAVSTPTSPAERLRLINRYVEHEAMERVLFVLVGNQNVPGAEGFAVQQPTGFGTVGTARQRGGRRARLYEANELWGQLWPEDKDLEGDEFLRAEAPPEFLRRICLPPPRPTPTT